MNHAASSVRARAPRSLKQVWRRRHLIHRLPTSPLRALPDFVIIGAQKAGTTSLYRYLVQHPQVLAPVTKEVHFYDWDYAKGLGWYRAHFPTRRALSTLARRSGSPALTGEASPYYLFHPDAARRLAADLPDAKLIAMLRDPVDRAWSQYHHNRKRGGEPLTFEEAVDREEERIGGEAERLLLDPAYRSAAHRRYSYKARGVYADQLPAWLERFPPRNMLIVRSEDFFADPAAAYKQVLEFLELPILELREYRPFLAGSYGEPMAAATRARLAEYFRPHNARLEALLGREFGWD